MIDDCYINNLAKNQPADFHSRVIRRSVPSKFIELCMKTPCLYPSEGQKYGGRKVTKTSVIELLKRKIVTLEFRPVEINASSSASTV